ncbi:16S rRNA (guanine(527)-N(7))-methyltransferase [hydrothermal vent metagenome]|uniref:16S rRNA (Guanine(527)-N(7))-methyltransferase n=1 Tax=hydrothermal vent metagenome TaxID=652676 RepID=A0A3B0X8U7_9ZZZZ
MKEPLRQQLEFGLKQMGLRYPVEIQQKLVHYIQLIARWNKAFNLTAIRDVEEMVSKHLLDSLVVQPYLEGSLILDIGSGAGLPGIPFAITSPDKKFVLIDSNGKKTRFLVQAKIDLKLDNVEVIQQRVEDFQPMEEGHRIYFDVITARAYANTDAILNTSAHLQNEATRILVMQGKLDEQIKNDQYQLVESHSLDVYGLDAERHLLEIKRLKIKRALI